MIFTFICVEIFFIMNTNVSVVLVLPHSSYNVHFHTRGQAKFHIKGAMELARAQ